MTRTEKLRQLKESEKRKTIHSYIMLLLIFATVYSATYGYMVSKENTRIKNKIENYDSDLKVFYLKQDIERGNY